MEKLEYVLTELNRRKGQLGVVAKNTHVSLRTITYVMSGRDVRVSTLDALHKYLKENIRRKIL
jgi:predicted transcriptional regulator